MQRARICRQFIVKLLFFELLSGAGDSINLLTGTLAE
jgi:hypothetical protein